MSLKRRMESSDNFQLFKGYGYTGLSLYEIATFGFIDSVVDVAVNNNSGSGVRRLNVKSFVLGVCLH